MLLISGNQQRLIAFASVVLFALATATPTDSKTHAATTTASNATVDDNDNNNNNNNNYNCPEDCHCVLARNTHKPFLHAKCSTLNGLKSDAPLQSTLPIHSIDLSYMSLSRLSHTLDKFPDLTSIDLSHNELHEIGHLGRRIKKLNLKHNRITSSKLSKLPQHVQVLNLQHNDITYLPMEFTKLLHLQTLELSHNQINCSCETLEVRNWLQMRHVFMEHPVKCSFPPETNGKSWLQIKQSEICDKEHLGLHKEEDENELMLGDQPMEEDNDNDDEDELGKAFLPIDLKSTTPKTSDLKLDEDVEGSGDLGVMNLPISLQTTTENSVHEILVTDAPEEDDGSGSGAGMLFIPRLREDSVESDDFDTPDPAIFNNGMGIFEHGEKTDKPVNEEIIVPVVHHNLDEENAAEGQGDLSNASEPILQAEVGKNDDSNATYFLLGVIALIVIGLLLFVGIKRCKQKRDGQHDLENQRQTELLDMDKKNPGKPMRNGKEHAPLIGEKTKADMAKPINGANKNPYDSKDIKDGPTQQQPLLNGSGATNGTTVAAIPHEQIPVINEPLNESAPHEYYPITPRYPPPKSPRASKYGQGEHNNNNPDDSYLPSSPKSGRYSPVYSPETGRVKIKLTETPKPKTPMLVTRTKSDVGDIITTPLRASHLEEPPVVHVGGGGNLRAGEH